MSEDQFCKGYGLAHHDEHADQHGSVTWSINTGLCNAISFVVLQRAQDSIESCTVHFLTVPTFNIAIGNSASPTAYLFFGVELDKCSWLQQPCTPQTTNLLGLISDYSCFGEVAQVALLCAKHLICCLETLLFFKCCWAVQIDVRRFPIMETQIGGTELDISMVVTS